MNILLTNDDGFEAPGIWVLANRLKNRHKIYIVAPDSGCSGASHSASFFTSLSYEYKGNIEGVEVYSISGTPADCIVFSVMLPFPFRRVLTIPLICVRMSLQFRCDSIIL